MLKLADILKLADDPKKEPIDLTRVKPRLADVCRHVSNALDDGYLSRIRISKLSGCP
jgi:hypothetical protein